MIRRVISCQRAMVLTSLEDVGHSEYWKVTREGGRQVKKSRQRDAQILSGVLMTKKNVTFCHKHGHQRSHTASLWTCCLRSKMPNSQLIHGGDPAYAPPVIRPPSPASSVGTAYQADQTSQSDTELSKEEFEQKWLGKLNLDGLAIEEDKSRPVLIESHPQEGSPEEKRMYIDSHRENNSMFLQSFLRAFFRGSGHASSSWKQMPFSSNCSCGDLRSDWRDRLRMPTSIP